jgi:hypothetical protein
MDGYLRPEEEVKDVTRWSVALSVEVERGGVAKDKESGTGVDACFESRVKMNCWTSTGI